MRASSRLSLVHGLRGLVLRQRTLQGHSLAFASSNRTNSMYYSSHATKNSNNLSEVTISNALLYRHFADQPSLLAHLESSNANRIPTLDIPVENFVLKLFTQVDSPLQLADSVRVAILKVNGAAKLKDLTSVVSKAISQNSSTRSVTVLTPNYVSNLVSNNKKSLIGTLMQTIRESIERALNLPHSSSKRDANATSFSALDPNLDVLTATTRYPLYFGVLQEGVTKGNPSSEESDFKDIVWLKPTPDSLTLEGQTLNGQRITLRLVRVNGGINIGLEGGHRTSAVKSLAVLVLLSSMMIVFYTYVSNARSSSDSLKSPVYINEEGKLTEGTAEPEISFIQEPTKWIAHRMGFKESSHKRNDDEVAAEIISDPTGWFKRQFALVKENYESQLKSSGITWESQTKEEKKEGKAGEETAKGEDER